MIPQRGVISFYFIAVPMALIIGIVLAAASMVLYAPWMP